MASNPLTMWVAGISLALSAVLAYLGKVSSEVKDMATEHEQLAKKMGGAQRAFQTLTDLYGKAAQAGNLDKEITKEHKEEIEKLVRTTPSLHGVIDTSVKKYGQLATSIKNVNNQMQALSDNNLNAYNRMVDQLEKMKANRGFLGLGMSYNDELKHIEGVKAASLANAGNDPKKIEAANARYVEALNEAAEKFKHDPSVRKLIDTMLLKQASISYGNPTNPLKNDPEMLEVSKYVKSGPVVSPPSNTNPYPTEGIGDKTNGNETVTGIDMAEAQRKWNNSIYNTLQKNSITTLETKLKSDLEELKNETDPDIYTERRKAIEEAIKKLQEETLKAFTEQKYTDLANAVGAEYDPSKKKPFQFPNTPEGNLNFKNYSEYVAKNPGAFMTSFQKAVESNGFVTAAGTDLKNLKIPEFKADKLSKDNTLRAEVVESRRLEKLQYELNIRKSMASTQQEVEDLEKEGLLNQEQSVIKLRDMFQTRVETVEKEKALFKTTEDYNAALTTAKDNLDAIKVKLKGIQDQQEEANKTGFLDNFKVGAKKSSIAFGSEKSLTQQIGADVTSTALNGMVNVIDLTIGKLAQLQWSWKNFATALGGIMKDIAAELQKYIAKMLVVWAVEQMVKIFSSSGSSANFNNTPSGAEMPAFNTDSDMFSKGSWYADGGLITGGVQGVDSVPIMTMPDEYVVKSSVVRSMGLDFMDALNAGKVRKFANGGLSKPGSASASGDSMDGLPVTLQIVNLVDPSSIPQTSDNQIINVINFDLARKGSTYKTIKTVLN